MGGAPGEQVLPAGCQSLAGCQADVQNIHAVAVYFNHDSELNVTDVASSSPNDICSNFTCGVFI
jgi:hypothetical protein